MKYLVCGDIHLGHQRTPTSHIIKSFKESVLNEINKNIDVLFIEGDLFDRLLELNTKEVSEILEFINFMLSYCAINNILLRILEGTPSHEWSQSRIVPKLNEIRTNKCDLRYHNVLDIEYIERIGKYVLYVPDEWTDDHSDLEKQIEEKMLGVGITKVDIAILHGAFSYQTGGKKYSSFLFEEDYFLSVVRGYIHVGHYHVHSTLDRIIAAGSLERLSHGEEEHKGYIVVENDSYCFVPNTNAKIYKTINITSNYTIDKLDKTLRKYPPQSNIRLNMNSDHPFNTMFNEIKARYLDYNLKKKIKDIESESEGMPYILSVDDIEINSGYMINIDLHELLKSSIPAKYQLTKHEESKLNEYLLPLRSINNDNIAST